MSADTRLAPARTASATIRVRLPAGQGKLNLSDDLARAAELLCSRQSLPLPAIAIEEDPALPADTFAVDLDGVTRVCGGPATYVSWWQAHPAAGPAGRTGIFRRAGFGLREVVGRAVEETLWDDPGLLLPQAVAEEAVRAALDDGASSDSIALLATAVREVAHRRVPIPSDQLPEALRSLVDLGGPRHDLAAVERHDRSPERMIPDGVPLGIRDAIDVELDQPLASLSVRVHLRHTDPKDLRVRLEAPDGTTAVLWDCSYSSSVGTDLTLEATPATDPALKVFVGKDAAGEWALHVADLAQGDVGTLAAWSLELFGANDADQGEHDPGRDEDPAESVRRHVVRVERLTRALRPYEVSLRMGARLYEAALPPADDEDDASSGTLDALLHAAAVPSRLPEWCVADDLEPWEYEVVVNGLPRARGEIPPDRVFVPFVTSNGDEEAVDPETGAPGSWLTRERAHELGRLAATPREWLTKQLAASLGDEIAELCDLGWTERIIDLVAGTSPLLAEAVRKRFGPEQAAYALGRLASEGYSIRNGRVLETLLQAGQDRRDAAELDAAASPGLAVADFPGAAAEFVALRLRESVWSGPPVRAIACDPALEDLLRASVAQGAPPEPIYSFDAAPVLAALDKLLASGAPPILVTSGDVRRHMRRLIKAQFPTVRVVARENVEPTVGLEVTHHLS